MGKKLKATLTFKIQKGDTSYNTTNIEWDNLDYADLTMIERVLINSLVELNKEAQKRS